MSEHPNVLLIARLTPDDLSRKTMKAILLDGKSDDDDCLPIGEVKYHTKIMETDYDNGYQISAKEGDLIFFDLVTYGYGEVISWGKLQAQKEVLEIWAKDICARFHCAYEILIGANYW